MVEMEKPDSFSAHSLPEDSPQMSTDEQPQAEDVAGAVQEEDDVLTALAPVRPNWERNEEELAAARQVTWPPAHGHEITLASFGCLEEEADIPSQRHVHESLVHKCDHLKAGDECLCLDTRDGQQWLATIKKVKPHHAQVHYKGWSKSTDSWVTRDKLALKPSPQVLERIKQYNDHSKLRQAGTPKNQLSAAQPCSIESLPPAKRVGEPFEGREVRSRLRGVELYRMPSTRYPDGQWRAVQITGNQKQSIGNLFSTKDDAGKAWADRNDRHAGAGAAKRAEDETAATTQLSGAHSLARNLSEGCALGARVQVDMGCRRRRGTVIAWISARMLYQIRLDGSGNLVHLPIPHKRIALTRPSVAHKPAVTPKAVGVLGDLSLEDPAVSAIDLLGGTGIMDEMQDISDTLPHDHVVGNLALDLVRLRHLARSCQAHGVKVCQSALQGCPRTVQTCLQTALHHALEANEGSNADGTGGGKAESADKHGRQVSEADPKKDYQGVRTRVSGTKKEREFNKWEAFIELGGQAYTLGFFACKIEAARAWDMAAKKMLPRTTPLNLPDSLNFLPSQELDKTLTRVTLTAATCNGFRPVPVVLNFGNGGHVGTGYIPVPASHWNRAGQTCKADARSSAGERREKKKTRQRDRLRVRAGGTCRASHEGRALGVEAERRSSRKRQLDDAFLHSAPGRDARQQQQQQTSRQCGALGAVGVVGHRRSALAVDAGRGNAAGDKAQPHNCKHGPSPTASSGTTADASANNNAGGLMAEGIDSSHEGGRAGLDGAACLPEKRIRKRKMPFGQEADEGCEKEAEGPGSSAKREAADRDRARGPGRPAAGGTHVNSSSSNSSSRGGRGGQRRGPGRPRKVWPVDHLETQDQGHSVVEQAGLEYTAQGAMCEVLWDGDWWAATVVVRRQQILRVAYVGGSDDDDEWISEEEWATRLRAPVLEESLEDVAATTSYRGVERSSEDGTLWACVVNGVRPLLAIVSGSAGAGAGDSGTPQSCRASSGPDDSAVGGSKEEHEADDPAKVKKHVLGTFTTAREAAEFFDLIMLELMGEGQGVHACLNFESSRSCFSKHKAAGRSLLPKDLGEDMRVSLKQALLAQTLAQRLAAHSLRNGESVAL
jgi:hypothetical protein